MVLNMRTLAIGLLGFVCLILQAGAAGSVKLYLNAGDFIAVDSTQFPYYAFNPSPVFRSNNEVLQASTGDTLLVTVVNTDTVPHGFKIKGYPNPSVVINPQDSVTETVVCNLPGLFIYHDDLNSPKFDYMGAAGMLLVESPNSQAHFYWNFKEHQSTFNQDLANNQPVNFGQYDPDYYTVNGKGKPDILGDPSAVVIANVGDTVRILMANTGRSAHSIHFHGFHCTITYASESPVLKNRSKDTLPLRSMETMILEMVPDKPGFYPVHDHNLIAISGGGYYPNGIFMMMEIQ